MTGEHRSWCRETEHCTCEFENRRSSRWWRLRYRIAQWRGCKHTRRGSYGSNDAWCLGCGVLIGGPPRAGEVGYFIS